MTRPTTIRILLGVALASLLAAALVPTPTSAQTINNQLGAFGTQVKVGDFDYLPLTKRAAVTVRALEADYGMPGEVKDNCILLMMDNTDSGATRFPGTIVAPPPAVQTPRTDVYTKDIRLTPCQGKPVGTAITDTDLVEQTTPYYQRAVEVRYVDASGDGKFGRGDPVYLTTRTGSNLGLATTTGTGAWTIRLTPVDDKPAGSFVFPQDSDFIAGKATATGATPPGGSAAIPQRRSFNQVEREGNGWYIIPAGSSAFPSVAAAPFTDPQQPLPVNSIRIGLVGANNQQPLVNPSNIDLPGAAPQAGETYKITVKFSNDGTGAGAGLLVTRIDGVIVDARLTPVLAPGEGAQVLIPVPMPEHGGRMVLQVADFKVNLDVEGPAASATDFSGPSTTDLAARIAELEAKLATTQGEDVARAKAGVPGLAPAVLMGALAAFVALLRRRAA